MELASFALFETAITRARFEKANHRSPGSRKCAGIFFLTLRINLQPADLYRHRRKRAISTVKITSAGLRAPSACKRCAKALRSIHNIYFRIRFGFIGVDKRFDQERLAMRIDIQIRCSYGRPQNPKTNKCNTPPMTWRPSQNSRRSAAYCFRPF